MEQELKFVQGAVKNGVSRTVAEKLFRFIEPFAEYGFNRAHATCYAKIAYQTAYLKTHFPQEFLAALLTSEQNNLDKLAIAINEAERLGLQVLPPDVNESFEDFGVVLDTNNIRFGLAAIKNVGKGVAYSIVEERKENGLFKNFEDFLKRLSNKVLNKKVIEALARAGALDKFGERNQILLNVEEILKFISGQDNPQSSSQMGLFGSGEVETGKLSLSVIEPATKKQRLSWEKELLGMYISEHPLQGYEKTLKKYAKPIGEIKSSSPNQKVKVAGIISSIQKILTRSNEPMLFCTIEDTSAKMEVLVFPKTLKKDNLVWQADNIVLVEGRTNTKDGVLKMIAEEVKEIALQQTINKNPEKIIITFPIGAKKVLLEEIKKILLVYPGELPVFLKLPQNDEYREIKTKTKISLQDKLLIDLAALLGKENIEIE